MDIEKTPPTDQERLDALEVKVLRLQVTVDQLEAPSDKRWYDDLGCAVIVLILAAAWVIVTLADKGVFT